MSTSSIPASAVLRRRKGHSDPTPFCSLSHSEDPMVRQTHRVLAVLVVALSASGTARAQSSINPEISVIPRFLLSTDDGGTLSEGKREFSRPEFIFEELEVVFSGYLNPYARADVVLALAGPDVEAASLGLEEAYLTVLRGLPLDLNLRVGKYRAEFGKMNMMHPHQWPFVTQPLSQERFLGEESLNDLGLSASLLLPTGDVYTRLTVDVLRGLSIPEAAGLEDTTGGAPFFANSARLMGFFPVGDDADLEAGVSMYTGIHDPYNRDRFWYWNLDAKYRWRPDSYTSLVVQGEYLLNTRDAELGPDLAPFVDADGNPERRSITSGGLYIFGDYQFLKIFSVGARFDWSQAPYTSDEDATAYAVFFGYYPVEETIGLRLHYQHTRTEVSGGAAEAVNFIGLQALFSLGPHKAHPF